MFRIAILGCENSHANSFLKFIITDKEYTDIEVVGVYSNELEAAQKLADEFGVYVAESYDEFVGKIDGLIITARDGANHYKYAKPYIESGIPMFIDKPVTNSEEDAKDFKAELIKNKVKICGGSSLKHAAKIQELKKTVAEKALGQVYGGFLRAPYQPNSQYGGFFFYAQHLTQSVCEIFGYYPKSVKAFKNGDVLTCVFRYDECDVVATFVEPNYTYYAGVNCENGASFESFTLDGCYKKEFDEFYSLMNGGDQPQSYDEFFAPVYTMNAILRSVESGKEEKVNL